MLCDLYRVELEFHQNALTQGYSLISCGMTLSNSCKLHNVQEHSLCQQLPV